MTFYLVNRPSDSVIVSIMQRTDTKKYSFVNFTHPHICKCQFNTIEEALADMDENIRNGNVLSYYPISDVKLEPATKANDILEESREK